MKRPKHIGNTAPVLMRDKRAIEEKYRKLLHAIRREGLGDKKQFLLCYIGTLNSIDLKLLKIGCDFDGNKRDFKEVIEWLNENRPRTWFAGLRIDDN